MLDVLRSSRPLQIRDMVVALVSIFVVYLWLVLRVGYVAQGNQPMNPSVKPMLTPCLQDNTVVSFVGYLMGEDASMRAGNYTILTDLIDVAVKVVFHKQYSTSY